MKRTSILAILVCLLVTANFAFADTIRGIDIDFVTIGHAGNAADTGGTVGRGAVGYNYRIGMYEVTNAQWNAFTAAAGAPKGNNNAYGDSSHWSGDQRPIRSVSWYEAAQFCNYLTSGDKSKGAYRFSGNNANAGSFLGIDRDAAKATYSTLYVIPTENEWYKAAYYKPDGSGYSLYANVTNTIPTADNGWNFYGGAYGSPWNVGTGTQEQNGTYDMMGNVFEWNETLFDGFYRGLRGGSYSNPYGTKAGSSSWSFITSPHVESYDYGFRVVSIVPEPATLLLLALGGLLIRKR